VVNQGDMNSLKIRLSKCVVGPLEQAAVADVLASEFLGMGAETRAFEEELMEYLGGGCSVTCVATGTAALQLALQACGTGPGDEVIVPSLTFVACFQAVVATGATPVACEVDPATATIDIEDASKRITDRTRAILPVHYASYLPTAEAVYALARERGLRVVEDAAHAFGGRRNGARIGSEGDLVCFSFDGIKNITCGEGGAVATRDGAVQRVIEDARLLGVQRDTEARYQGRRSWEFDVVQPGWRYHMSNIMAAIGRTQLRRLDCEFAPRRVELARRYRVGLQALEGVQLLETDLDSVVPHIQPLRILGGRRDTVRAALAEAGIETGLHYKPNHLLTMFGGGRDSLPVTERLYDELLTLPLHADLADADVDCVVDAVRSTIAKRL